MDKLLADLDKNMRDIEYGWVDLDEQKHFDMDNFEKKYRLQAPEAIKASGVGVCFDQVELERFVFEAHHFNFWSFFIVYYDGAGCPSHSFILFEDNEKYYWYEHSWAQNRGVHEYDSLDSAINDITCKFVNSRRAEIEYFDPMNLVIYQYETPKPGLSSLEFYNHCEKFEQVRWKL